MPAYNASCFLSETIESVLNQAYQDWEMLIIDDGSTDSTLSIAQGYASRDSRVKALSLGYNSGIPAIPRNYGIRRAQGSYIAFLDSDDLWLPAKLQKQVNFLENNRDVFLLYSQCIIERDGKQLRIEPKNPKSGYIFNDLFLNFNFIDCLTVIMRNKRSENAYFFDEDKRLVSVEDYALWLLIARNEKISFMNEPLAIYRVHAKGISSNGFSNFRKCGLVLKKFSSFVSKLILFKAYLNFYLNLLFVGIMNILVGIKNRYKQKIL